ncbi:MAG TPA: serine/threonine-protein kinase [Gaiellaceae bacterium]|nr:serine/threonine-protein kinase [Gaiellaceae bacterium]
MTRYTVEKTLGRGGMATVELAEDTQLRRKVAVKRLFASLADDELFQERFFREARMAASLSHPNLVAVYDVGEEDGLPYIVMEYVAGETLAELMAREGPMPPDRAVDLLLQLCAGLEHAHAAGLVHRDIKPQNLLVRGDGVVKIGDFGIARTLQATQLTQVGTVLGTAAYLAPEQASGEPVTAAADIYSLGAVAYELLSGRTPYQFQTLTELVVKQQEPPPPLQQAPELDAVVRRCLAYKPEDRPQSAALLARELAAASPEPPTEPLPAAQVTAATEVIAPSRTIHVSRRALLALGVLLAALLIALGLALAYGGGGDASQQPQQPQQPRADVLPRGDTPAESARLLAEWLRERAE